MTSRNLPELFSMTTSVGREITCPQLKRNVYKESADSPNNSSTVCTLDLSLPYFSQNELALPAFDQSPSRSLLTQPVSFYSNSSHQSSQSGLSTPTEYLFMHQEQNKRRDAFDMDLNYGQNLTSSDFLDGFLNSFDQDKSSEEKSSLFLKQLASISSMPSMSSLSFNLPFLDFNTTSGFESFQSSAIVQNSQNASTDLSLDSEYSSKIKRQTKKRHLDDDFEYSSSLIITPKPKLNKTVKTELKVETSVNNIESSSKSLERIKTKKGLRKRRRNEWTSEEVVLLLLTTKKLINYELKTISQAVFEMIERDPGKCFGRAAEKKLKRLNIFENWKTCDKSDVIQSIDTLLESFEGLSEEKERELEYFVEKAKNESDLSHQQNNFCNNTEE